MTHDDSEGLILSDAGLNRIIAGKPIEDITLECRLSVEEDGMVAIALPLKGWQDILDYHPNPDDPFCRLLHQVIKGAQRRGAT